MSRRAQSAFRKAVREHLAPLDGDLVPVLGQLATHAYPPEVVALDFEVFGDAFTSRFPARAFFMDADNCEFFVDVDGTATYPSPVDPDLLASDGVYPEELEDKLAAADPDLDPWALATGEFIAWFADCWVRAGGRSLPLAATIAEHDSDREYNLQSGKWQRRGAAYDD